MRVEIKNDKKEAKSLTFGDLHVGDIFTFKDPDIAVGHNLVTVGIKISDNDGEALKLEK